MAGRCLLSSSIFTACMRCIVHHLLHQVQCPCSVVRCGLSTAQNVLGYLGEEEDRERLGVASWEKGCANAAPKGDAASVLR